MSTTHTFAPTGAGNGVKPFALASDPRINPGLRSYWANMTPEKYQEHMRKLLAAKAEKRERIAAVLKSAAKKDRRRQNRSRRAAKIHEIRDVADHNIRRLRPTDVGGGVILVPNGFTTADPVTLRRIMGNVAVGYIIANARYSAGHSDGTVAANVGCPISWVVTLREMFYGPMATTSQSDENVAEAKKLVADAKGLVTTAAKLVQDAERLFSR